MERQEEEGGQENICTDVGACCSGKGYFCSCVLRLLLLAKVQV